MLMQTQGHRAAAAAKHKKADVCFLWIHRDHLCGKSVCVLMFWRLCCTMQDQRLTVPARWLTQCIIENKVLKCESFTPLNSVRSL